MSTHQGRIRAAKRKICVSPEVPSWRVATAAVVAACLVALASGSTAPAQAARLSPPVIRESFTPLPCSGSPGSRTTLQQEGCAEREIIQTDAKINALSRSIFSSLFDDAARRRFANGTRAWLAYRRVDCLSRSDVFEGGTQAALVDAQCNAARNATRIKDLQAFTRDLRRGG